MAVMLSSISIPSTALAADPLAVDLLSANNFTILAKTGITNTGSHSSEITGNIGSSPITAAAMSNVYCSEITGTIYGVDAAYVGSGDQTCFAGNPPVENKTLVDNAILDMETAYNNLANMTDPTATELGAGNIGGLTITPGLYKWSSNVIIPTNVILSGSATDIWIFQIAGNLNLASAGDVSSGIKVVLSGGAQASNIFWQVGGLTGATLGTYSTFNGNILSAKQIILETGSILNGKALAQTQVTLDANIVSSSAVVIQVEPPAVDLPTVTPPVVITLPTTTSSSTDTITPIINDTVTTPLVEDTIEPTITATETITPIISTTTPSSTITPKLPSAGTKPNNSNASQILFSLLGLSALMLVIFKARKKKYLS